MLLYSAKAEADWGQNIQNGCPNKLFLRWQKLLTVSYRTSNSYVENVTNKKLFNVYVICNWYVGNMFSRQQYSTVGQVEVEIGCKMNRFNSVFSTRKFYFEWISYSFGFGLENVPCLPRSETLDLRPKIPTNSFFSVSLCHPPTRYAYRNSNLDQTEMFLVTICWAGKCDIRANDRTVST